MAFAKHQSFYIREGWLTKGIKAIDKDERFFHREDAFVKLGLGKNMVQALRWWMQATGLAGEKKKKGSKNVNYLTEDFGEKIKENDKYIENKNTLWLIHYHLASNENEASTWYWFFNIFKEKTFKKEDIIEKLSMWAENTFDKKVAETSLNRDVDCFIRTYLPSNKQLSPEDTMECPLTSLNLLKEDLNDRKVYHFNSVDKSQINPLVVAYCICDWAINIKNSGEVTLDELLRSPKTVGLIFNLDFTSLTDILFQLDNEYPELGFKVDRTAGLDIVKVPIEDGIKNKILNLIYQRESKTTLTGGTRV
ncbi:DUF4007 family protein [Natranaerofaba carboxydovora]|uniref:DUF4007 family protein n=1 Tax=Natranaerofaba carboxydovora TaxID=2742683 RepID=UPI001F144156|nr:DUF4007 family protein [Natranaerofaba carboxydovora]UMZ74365.1 hypothetical protein ACONDI_01953 [Natranaerofaba carboxydovora]